MWASALKEQEEASKEQKQEEPEEKEDEVSEKLKKFLDIPLQVEVIVGYTTITLGELLHLSPALLLSLNRTLKTLLI